MTNQGLLSLVLLDADYENSTRVIDRLMERMNHYDFPAPLRLSVGAACYPTDAVDAQSLQRQAVSHPVISWRGGHPRANRSNRSTPSRSAFHRYFSELLFTHGR